MSDAPIIRKNDLVKEATDWVREQIFSGHFSEGESLPSEGELAGQLGVSRNVLREAMRNLRTQGLIEVSQGKRPKVKAIDGSAADAAICTLDALLRRSGATQADLMMVRIPLESEIAAIAAEKATASNVTRLKDILSELKSASSDKERIRLDISFHRYLAEITGNPVFVLMLDTLSGLSKDAHAVKFPKVGIKTAVKGHTDILNAIQKGSSNAARKAMLSHLEDSKNDLKK